MKIVIAPNAFKNSLSADKVAEALALGLREYGYQGAIVQQPVGDGGDGTGALLRHYLQAETIWSEVVDPLGRPIRAPWGWVVATKTAVIELADASGLRLLRPEEYNPLKANTAGCGQLIKAALNKGAAEILLCIGGSATVDGGAGMLHELGVEFYDTHHQPLPPIPEALLQLQYIDASMLDERLEKVSIKILCDVKNKLLGEQGAAAIFGPQKGANAKAVMLLEKMLGNFARQANELSGVRIDTIVGGGAAGGVAAGLSAFCSVTIVDGIYYFLEKIGFEKILEDADCVITGEGVIDRQTIEGKAPFGVATLAKEKGIKVIGVAGKITDEKDEVLRRYFDNLLCINKEPLPLEEAISRTRYHLIAIGKDILDCLPNR